MEERSGVAGQGLPDPHSGLLEQFKRNDELFRNTMEGIFQKYSNLDDPGHDVCFKTMTFRTRKGIVPLQSAEAEEELQHLRNRAEQSIRVLDNSKVEQMDVTQRTENDLDPSLQTGNSDVSLWHGSETSQLSVNSVSGSRSCLWDLSQPEEEDEDLERTLNSQNRNLLDIYPSMLNQIGAVYRRQHVTKAASAVLRRYRRQRWKSSQTQSRNHVLSSSFNHTLNRTMDGSVPVQKLPHNDITSYQTDLSSYEEAPAGRGSQKRSPMKINKNSFLVSSRSDQELSPLMTKRTLSLASIRNSPELSSLKAMQDSSTASKSKKQELSPLTTKRNVSLAFIRSSQELSPLKAIRNASLATSSSSRELSPLKAIRNASLATSSSSRELSPLKAIRNASLATSSSSRELSPLKVIRNASLATSSSSRELSPLKAIRNAGLPSTSSNQELSPLKAIHNSPFASSACFYSPRRADVENSPAAESQSHWNSPGLHLNSKPQHQPVRVLDLSTPPSSAYNAQLDKVPESNGVFSSVVWSPKRSMYNSPLKGATSVSLTGQGGRPVVPSPSRHCPSQLGQQFSGTFVEKECFRDHQYSPTPSQRKTLPGNPSFNGRNPLKPRVFSLEQEQPTSMYYPKQTVPVNHTATLQTYRSPYLSQQEVSSSPYHSPRVFSDHQENLAMPEVLQHSTKLMKHHQSFSDIQSTSSSVSHMSSRQIDAEFRRLYHHFVCRGNSPSCITSSCHLCERQLQTGNHKPPSTLSNVSALALTPVESQLRKRRRQPEEEDSVRIKRFRESCSPKKQQQFTKYTSAAVANPSEEKRIWNRALLLQCPSPGFLRSSETTRKSSRSQTGLQNHSYSPSWRDTTGSIGAAEATSPVRACNQSGVSLLPSVSRRRLLYGPLQ